MGAATNRMRLAYARELTYKNLATDPAATLKDMRLTGESLAQQTETAVSTELRHDRMKTDVMRLGINASGSTEHELSYGDFDALLESALQSDSGFTTAVNLAAPTASVEFVASTQRIQATGIHTDAIVGDWVKISGATNAANNGLFKITAKDTGFIVVGLGLTSLVNETSTATTVRQLSAITNGVTADSYTIEKEFTDMVDTFAVYKGMVLNTLSLNLEIRSIATMSIGWIGASEESTTSGLSPSGNTPAGTNPVFTSLSTVDLRATNVSSGVLKARKLDFSLNNNIRVKDILGEMVPYDFASGSFGLTGSLESYFTNSELLDAHFNFTDARLITVITDSAGNSYLIEVPSVKYTEATRTAGGEDQDIIAVLNWTAKMHPTEGIMMRIVRIPA